uniref:Uncharacterized protein n=1 Tax=Globisporangium ultimum (strain ATCC 200006 / CBS 805.95 / DAOM BR144) TaxID=431595 RepID=K3WA93_GLOUD
MRQAIGETLHRLHDDARARCAQEEHRREDENERTRSVAKVMQLDSKDYAKILVHAQNVTLQNEIASILDRIKALEQTYQLEKKRLASIHDKKARHERVQQEKKKRDDAVVPLRTRLTQLESSSRPRSSPSLHVGVHLIAAAEDFKLPAVDKQQKHGKLLGRKKSVPPNYREMMELIRKIQHERKSLLDPYMANLKKREALHFLFMRSLQLKERVEAADLIDTVENMHVRKREYGPAKALSDRFVKLPEVKRASLFASFAALQNCSMTVAETRL